MSSPSPSNAAGYPIHPIAGCWVELTGQAWRDFLEDVRAHGVRVPAKLFRGELIDGRQRQRACLALGLVCPTEEWDGVGSLASYVASLNLYRRHESLSDKHFAAAALVPFFQAEARARMQAGTLPSIEARVGRSTEQAAQATGSNRSATERARHILEQGTPELGAAARAGTIPLYRASILAGKSAEQQLAAMAAEGQTVLPADAASLRTEALRKLQKWRLKGLRVLLLLYESEAAAAPYVARLELLVAQAIEGLPGRDAASRREGDRQQRAIDREVRATERRQRAGEP